MSGPLDRIDAELAKLQATQSNFSNTGDAARRQVAATRRAQMESGLKRSLDYIDRLKESAAQVQARLKALHAAGGESDRLDHEKRWLGEESKKKVDELEILVVRAKQEAAWAKPRIAWCLRVEGGMSDADANRLAELEAAEAARAELARPRQVVEVTLADDGEDVQP